jgi:hypothetical protein
VFVAGVVLVLSACGAPTVRVTDVPSPDQEDARDCQALHADLPTTIGNGLHQRTVKPTNPDLAAWGTPAVVLRCGVGVPATYRPGTDLTIVNNIGWYGDERPDDVIYTTITRQPRIAVAIPRTLSSSFEILVDLSAPIARHTQGPDLTPQ